jgi:SseB protein N-terminal domain
VQGLTVAEPRFPGDDGTADPAVRTALAAYAAGQGSEHAALTALARSRLLVPVVAVLGEAGEDGSEKSTEMALPTLVGRDGRRAVLAFTCLDALKQWRGAARPVPVPAASAWLAGTQDGASAVLIDVAGPVTLAVDGARLAALAAGRPVPPPDQDPEVLAALQSALAHEPLIVAAALTSPGQRVTATAGADPGHAGLDPNGPSGTAAEEGADGASPGADLTLQVTLAPGCDPAAAGAAVRRAADALLAATGNRLRRGVEVSVAQGSQTAGSP